MSPRSLRNKLWAAAVAGAAALSTSNAYFLFAMNDVITIERLDPIVSPGQVASHVHTVMGGSNFRATTNTSFLRASECTSSPIKQDKSNYWAPVRSFSIKLEFRLKRPPNADSLLPVRLRAVLGVVVVLIHLQLGERLIQQCDGQPSHVRPVAADYLFSDTPGATTPFPDDFRMISGNPTLRSYNGSDYAQQAITFLCLDFSGVSTRFNQIPAQGCPSGMRAQINFPMCWDGKNADSPDHKSHVAFPSGGADSGACTDPKYPKTLPRIFMEMYLDTASWWNLRGQAMNPNQPFVYSMGDPTGFGYHADFMMGWDANVLQGVVDRCNCNPYGDPTCCSNAGVFTFEQGGTCRITQSVDEVTTGTIKTLPGNNPVVGFGANAPTLSGPAPPFIQPVYAYTGDSPTQTGTPVGGQVVAQTSAPGSAGDAPVAVPSAPAVIAPAFGNHRARKLGRSPGIQFYDAHSSF
ncbi:unnamed protein product [Mycena citricolor]|uniref:DUF1996 domain-containing protein n=1 Tax=Mycena citricolor TaxID=2018698 RepID=A0AAD2H8L5_9AGAR|nr:unnamed protein product [Mycena citricolor]